MADQQLCVPCGSGGQAGLDGVLALMCTKCCLATTMKDSTGQGGRNPMKRVCHACAATDKSADRSRNNLKKKVALGFALTAEDVDLKTLIAKKSPEDRVMFYQDERKKREALAAETEGARRSMSDIKGTLETGTEHQDEWDDVDGYETFEDYVLRQIQLKRCDSEASAEILWKKELSENKKPKVWRREQWLLGKYQGLSHHQKQTESMRLIVKRSQAINDQSDFDTFKEIATSTYEKRLQGLDTKYDVVAPSGPQVEFYDVEGDVAPLEDRATSTFGSKSVNKLLMEELQKKKMEEERIEKELIQKGVEFAEKERERENAELLVQLMVQLLVRVVMFLP